MVAPSLPAGRVHGGNSNSLAPFLFLVSGKSPIHDTLIDLVQNPKQGFMSRSRALGSVQTDSLPVLGIS